MTLYEFTNLNDYEQACAVWNGQYITDRVDGDMSLLLYSVDDFFVEVIYEGEHNKIIVFNSFIARNLLDPYLQSIELPELEDLL
jgi:hypothetical protein